MGADFDGKLGNSRFCASVVQIWFPYALSFSHIHSQQYPLWNTALLVHCNNAGIAAPASGGPYKSHMKHSKVNVDLYSASSRAAPLKRSDMARV